MQKCLWLAFSAILPQISCLFKVSVGKIKNLGQGMSVLIDKC